MRTQRDRGGFTLVEMVVVMLLIVLIAGFFLIPRLMGTGKDITGRKAATPRQRAGQVVVGSNTHQLDMALRMYRDDNDGQNPPDLQALKRYGATDEMLRDPVTHQPLAYNPQTGQIGNGGPQLPRTPGF